MAKNRKKPHGIPGYIKADTLRKLGTTFFKCADVINLPGENKEVLLSCSGMKIMCMNEITYVKNLSIIAYAMLISDFLQALLEPYGLKIGRPIPDENGGFTFLVCR